MTGTAVVAGGGIGDALRSVSVPSEAAATLRTPDGRYLMRFRPGRDTVLLANHRADFHHALLDRLPPGVVHTGAEVTGVEQTDAEVTVTYGAKTITADLLVGADGIHSRVRREVWPDAPEPSSSASCAGAG